MEEYKFKGTGTVLTYTIIYSATEGFERQTPYILAIIELDEGPRLTGQIVSSRVCIEIGTRVKSVFRILGKEGEKGIIYYGTKFIPIEESV